MIRSAPVAAADVGASGATASELPPTALAFLEHLRRMPLGAWADAGRRLAELDEQERRTRGRSGTRADATVRAELRRAVNARPRAAAQARQRVLDLAAVAHGFLHPSDVARMKKAALAAVLALIARPELGEQQFAAVYEPFATLIPLATLPNGGVEHGMLDELAPAR